MIDATMAITKCSSISSISLRKIPDEATTTVIAFLPMDIILFEILSRLPAKTLIRFKSVCKTWYGLIENPFFIKTHIIRMQNGETTTPSFSIMLVHEKRKCSQIHFSEASDGLVKPVLPYLSSEESSCYVLGECNGLLCVALCRNHEKLVICNPTTGHFRHIPPIESPQVYLSRVYFIGFDLQNNGSELVRISCSSSIDDDHRNDDDELLFLRVHLYSMRTDTWRETKVKVREDLSFVCAITYSSGKAVAIDGVFYWYVEYGGCNTCVVYYDVRKEVFDAIKTPYSALNRRSSLPPDMYYLLWLQLVQVKVGVLALVYYRKTCGFEISVLNRGDMTWGNTKKIPFHIQEESNQLGLLGCTRDGELILVNLFWPKLTLFSLNPVNRKVECFWNLNDWEGVEFIIDAHLYIASLQPVVVD